MLDLGCGDGDLLKHLMQVRQVHGYGVENDPDKLLASVKNGVNVIQMDLEKGLVGLEDGFFDHVIMSLSLQAMHNTQGILHEMLRVGREAVVSFPNFGYWRHRQSILNGRMPVSESLPHQWFNTPQRALLHHRRLRRAVRDERHRGARAPGFRRGQAGARGAELPRQRGGVPPGTRLNADRGALPMQGAPAR